MASRRIGDCEMVLVMAWNDTESTYKERYPFDPQPILTCTHRSNEEQDRIYAIGRTVKGKKITNAKAGQSPHNLKPSKAFDIAFLGIDKQLHWDAGYFERFAKIIKEKYPMVEWGGDWEKFRDMPHFQLKNWKK